MIPPKFIKFMEQIVDDDAWEYSDGTLMTEDTKAMLTEGRVGANAPNPQADLHTVGTVSRIKPSSLWRDFGDIWPEGIGDSFTECLLRFEGKRVEVSVRLIETQEV